MATEDQSSKNAGAIINSCTNKKGSKSCPFCLNRIYCLLINSNVEHFAIGLRSKREHVSAICEPAAQLNPMIDLAVCYQECLFVDRLAEEVNDFKGQLLLITGTKRADNTERTLVGVRLDGNVRDAGVDGFNSGAGTSNH